MDKLLEKSKKQFPMKILVLNSDFIRGLIASKKDLIELFDLNGSEYFGAFIAYVLRKGVPKNTVPI